MIMNAEDIDEVALLRKRVAELEARWKWRDITDGEWKPMTRYLLFVPPYGPTTGHYDEGRWHCHSVLNKDAQPTGYIPLPIEAHIPPHDTGDE